MKKKKSDNIIYCPRCLKDSSYRTDDDDFPERLTGFFEPRFEKQDMSGWYGEGFLVACTKCRFEFKIEAYYTEPELKVLNILDVVSFLECRNVALPKWIKNTYDLRHLQSVFSSLIRNCRKVPTISAGDGMRRDENRMFAFLQKAMKKAPEYEDEDENAKEIEYIKDELFLATEVPIYKKRWYTRFWEWLSRVTL